MKILLLTHHTMYSPNRAGFHHLAASFVRLGYDVSFCSTPYYTTLAGFVKHLFSGDKRFQAFRTIISAFFPHRIEGIEQSAWIAPAYPLKSFPGIGNFLTLLYRKGFSRTVSRGEFDCLVFESEQCLLLMDQFKNRFPKARFIYRVSDDLEMMGAPREVQEQESLVVGKFDLVSSPSTYISKRLRQKQANTKIVDMTHGIHKKVFEEKKALEGPYDRPHNALFVGVNYLDWEILTTLALAFPDWIFHVIGNPPGKRDLRNIRHHGVLPFEDTISYIAHADVGLMTLVRRPGIEVFERTLKFIQYTYCRLPIVTPEFLNVNYEHVISYFIDKESLLRAFMSATEFDHGSIDQSWIRDWDEVATEVLDKVGLPAGGARA